jgi:serine/threonine-protein kinase
MPAQSRVTYIPPGAGNPAALLFYRDGALVAQPFDLDNGLSGEPMTVLNAVDYNAASIQAAFRASADGRIIIAGAPGSSLTRLVWYSRKGEEIGTLGPPGEYAQPRLSPDGMRVLFQQPDPQTGNRDVWHTEIARSITSRLTTHVANDWYPVWSPDGRQILFGSDRDGGVLLAPYVKTSMDPGSSESPLTLLDGEEPYDWSSDGRWISYGGFDLLVSSASGNGPQFAFLKTSAYESNGRFSPDTKWIAYQSNESGRFEIDIRPFAGGPAAATGKIQSPIVEANTRCGAHREGKSFIWPEMVRFSLSIPRTLPAQKQCPPDGTVQGMSVDSCPRHAAYRHSLLLLF